MTYGCRPNRLQAAFTLVELLVVIGIIALLISILLPALNKARQQGNIVKCASNVRQLTLALTTYAVEYKGKFPPLISAGSGQGWAPPGTVAPEMYWYSADLIGKYLPKTYINTSTNSIGGPIMVCPNDVDSARSYAVNIWSASATDQIFYNKSPQRLNARYTTWSPSVPYLGTFWTTGTKGSPNFILISEKFSAAPGAGGLYYAGPSLGYQGTKPGPRFLGNLSIATGGRFPTTETELDFSRHRQSKDKGLPAAKAVGRVNMGFTDGHVELLAQDELGDPKTGKSRLRALWSAYDRETNN